MRKMLLSILLGLFIFLIFGLYILKSDQVANNANVIVFRIRAEDFLVRLSKNNENIKKIVDAVTPSEIVAKGKLPDESGYLYRINGLKYVAVDRIGEDLYGIFQDTRGKIFKVRIYSWRNLSENSRQVISYLEFNVDTDQYEMKEIPVYGYETEFLENTFSKSKYFNVYWKDDRRLSDIKEYYYSNYYSVDNDPGVLPTGLILFK